ncbi:MAG: restriction endonuclease [Deltaproteobacteria bacterium]|nr:restriction endonuclease [Deltaproteobacteria bacterium]
MSTFRGSLRGGSRKDAGSAIGKSGDGGIDGIIKEDKLGLDAIYLQAKRWDSTVGRPEIQKFAGALQGVRAKKGVFITTSNFSSDAIEYVANIDLKIVLIDGEHLAQLMIDNDIGVSNIASYEIKKIDSDYFSEE